MAAKTLQTGPQPNGSHSVAWQTYVGHRLLLKVAASCCCHLPGRLVRRMVWARSEKSSETPLQCQSTKCWQACSTAAFPILTFSFPAQRAEEKIFATVPTWYAVHTMEIVRKLPRTAHLTARTWTGRPLWGETGVLCSLQARLIFMQVSFLRRV